MFDGMGRGRIVRNVIMSTLGCYQGVSYGNVPEVGGVSECGSWAGVPRPARHQPPFVVLPPQVGTQEVR